MARSNQITKAERETTLRVFSDASEKQAPLLKSMGIEPEQFNRILLNTLVRTPEIAKCTRDSIYASVYQACDMGLVPDGKHAAIVPFKNQAQLVPMYAGLLCLIRENIPNVAVNSWLVFDGDNFEDRRGSRPEIVHVPARDAVRSEKTLVAAYATAHFAGNDVCEAEVMYFAELKEFRKSYKGPWQSHPLEMYRTRPLKRLCKRLPLRKSLHFKLNEVDDEDEFQEEPQDSFIDAEYTEEAEPEPAPPKRTRRKAAPPPPPPEPEPEPEQPPADEDEFLFDDDEGAPA